MKDLYALFRQSLAGLRLLVAATLVARAGLPGWSSTASARSPRRGRPRGSLVTADGSHTTDPGEGGRARRSSASWSTTRPCSSRGRRRPATATTCSRRTAPTYGPEEPALIKAIKERKAEIAEREGVDPSPVPPDAVTASGSGLDPDISVGLRRRSRSPRVAGPPG